MLQLSMLGPASEHVIPPHRLRLYFTLSNAIAERLTILGVEPNVIHEAAEAVVDQLVGIHRSTMSRREYFVRLAGGKPICWLCGFPIPLDAEEDAPEAFSVDHVIPKSKGGKALGRTNLKPAHRACNIHRGNGTSKKRTAAKYQSFLARLERSTQVIPSGVEGPPPLSASK